MSEQVQDERDDQDQPGLSDDADQDQAVNTLLPIAVDGQLRLGREGRDEMNLAEFPFASLRTKGDSRKSIVYEGWVTDREGNRQHQRWTVEGSSVAGLPTEFDERVYVALMKITQDQGFASPKVPFSVYQILRIMGSSTAAHSYENVEASLERLLKATISADGAFWDNRTKKWTKVKTGFHLIDAYWLAYKETNKQVREEEGVPAYIVWSERLWNSFKANYIKSLDLDFFYSLKTPLARRLYRFLDKRMHYQRDAYEIDIFDLAGRLGMTRYEKPAHVRQKLGPALDELVRRGYLESAETVKRGEGGKYTRIRFVRGAGTSPVSWVEQGLLPLGLEEGGTVIVGAIPRRREDETWARALKQIEGTTTKATFDACFPRTKLVGIADSVATITVPDQATRELLEARLERLVREGLEAVGEKVTEVRFEVVR